MYVKGLLGRSLATIGDMHNERMNPLFNPLVTIIGVVGLIYVLVTQKMIVIPLVLGFFFALLLLRPVQRLEKHGIPRIFANFLMIILTIILVGGLCALIWLAVSQFISDIPQYHSAIQQNLVDFQEFIARLTKVSVEDQKLWMDQNLNLLEFGAKNAGSIIASASSLVSTLGLTFIYSFFILYYRDKLRVFIQKLLGGTAEANMLATMKKIARIIPNYLVGVFKVMIILGILNTAGLLIIGVHNAVFWGIIIAILNVVPYIGTIIGFAALVIFTLITQGLPLALGAVILFLITQFIDNNFLTPMIAGGTIDINPLAAILGLIVIGSMWGTVGLVLALPIIGMIKVIADSTPRYEAFGYLLGNQGTEEHAITWHNIKKRFRRSS